MTKANNRNNQKKLDTAQRRLSKLRADKEKFPADAVVIRNKYDKDIEIVQREIANLKFYLQK